MDRIGHKRNPLFSPFKNQKPTGAGLVSANLWRNLFVVRVTPVLYSKLVLDVGNLSYPAVFKISAQKSIFGGVAQNLLKLIFFCDVVTLFRVNFAASSAGPLFFCTYQLKAPSRCHWRPCKSQIVEFKKRAPDKRLKSGATQPGLIRNGYLVVFIFEPLWLLADMYILLWCLVG
jgi:hypothetical protein